MPVHRRRERHRGRGVIGGRLASEAGRLAPTQKPMAPQRYTPDCGDVIKNGASSATGRIRGPERHRKRRTSSRARRLASAQEWRTPPQQAFYPPGQYAKQDGKRYDAEEIDRPALGEGKRQRYASPYRVSSSLPTCRVSKNISLFSSTISAATAVTTIVSTHFVSGVMAIFSCMKFTNR